MFKRLIIAITLVMLSACASLNKEDTGVNLNTMPPTASGSAVWIDMDTWTGIGGKAVRSLTRNKRYPSEPTQSSLIPEFDFAESSGDKYGRRVVGLLSVQETGQYQFRLSADDSAEVWLSIDNRPINKRLIAFTNRPTGYLVWDRYKTQSSALLDLVAGEQYFVEVIHKENTGADYLRVEMGRAGADFAVVGAQQVVAYVEPVLEGGTGVAVDEGAVYGEGYHIGYTSGMNLAEYDASYPVPDQDNDGVPDFYERIVGTDPNDMTDALVDTDGDELSNYDEYLLLSSPVNADTDGDLIPDGFELIYGMALLDPSDALLDLDGDGISNIDEYNAGSLPNDPNDFPAGPVERVVSLSWDVPTQREDGSNLSLDEIQSYKIYSGTNPNSLSAVANVNDPAQKSYSDTLQEGTYYYAISTVTQDGLEGPRSSPITLVVN